MLAAYQEVNHLKLLFVEIELVEKMGLSRVLVVVSCCDLVGTWLSPEVIYIRL